MAEIKEERNTNISIILSAQAWGVKAEESDGKAIIQKIATRLLGVWSRLKSMPCGQLEPSWDQGGRAGGSGRREGGLEQGAPEGQADQEGHGGGQAEHGRVRYGVYAGRAGRGGGNTGKALSQVDFFLLNTALTF